MSTNVDADGGGVWVTCAQLASRKGISRQAATKRVAQLEQEGKLKTRRDGRSRLVDLAEYDRAVGTIGDAIKEIAADTARDQRGASASMRDAQTEKAQYEARLKALDLAERQRQLLPIAGGHGVEAAASEIGAALAKELDGLARYADDIAAAVSKEGVAGVRRLLKEIGTKIRTKIAAQLDDIAAVGKSAEDTGAIETQLPDE